MSNPDTPRIRDLIRDHYDIFDFAQDPDNLGYEDNFGHVSIYVRRPDWSIVWGVMGRELDWYQTRLLESRDCMW